MNDRARPNVIFVITDDQGYGDLGCTGNPRLKTPNIDRFHDEAARFNDFHAHPLCTPTRGAVMSGRSPVRNGAWATCWGRSILRADETTMADVFKANGYRTGMFGKWHLGDNYPFRPFDRGFERVVAHRGGGVGQTPDFWGNNYFDDTYFHNGQPRGHEGYCTDVWFEEAMSFIEERRDEPFFAYVATNAPHSPYLVADHYKKPYEGDPSIPAPAFYGMIANIDENFGKLDAKLDALGLRENTILLFMTDNGSSAGADLDHESFVANGYNAGMRGKKGSYYEGGHRVPFFMRWPAGGISGGMDVDDLALDVDILPSMIELCGLENTARKPFDGCSFVGSLDGTAAPAANRVHLLNIRQSTEPPEKERGCVMEGSWRLVHGTELYDVKVDPGQRENVADRHPEVVERLRGELERWWAEVSPGFDEKCCFILGDEAENPSTLNAMDVMGDVAWNQGMIIQAKRSTGTWNVDVGQAGRYRFSLRRWPEELPIPISGVVSKECAERVATSATPERVALNPAKATLKINGVELESDVDLESESVDFELDLPKTGPTVLDAQFIDPDGTASGAYYVVVKRMV